MHVDCFANKDRAAINSGNGGMGTCADVNHFRFKNYVQQLCAGVFNAPSIVYGCFGGANLFYGRSAKLVL